MCIALISLSLSLRSARQAAPYDPWWQGKGVGEARFTSNGVLTFAWPRDPKDGAEMNPFAMMGMDAADPLGWALAHGGRAVELSMHGRSMVQECATRHPRTWGWVLYSQGSVWTSWPMPTRADDDHALRDENLYLLPSDLPKDW
jgi:hypothetical protein